MKRLLYIFMMCMLCLLACAGNVSVRTKLALRRAVRASLYHGPQYGGGRQVASAFVVVDSSAMASLRRSGARVVAMAPGMATVRVPAGKLPALASMAGVQWVSLSQQLQLCNDSARYYCNVDSAFRGTGFSTTYDGRGVVLGMIDVGIDFNHVNFLDSLGNSRFVRVYMPVDSTGRPPVINGDTLPGSEYSTPQAIKQLTTDSPGLHGTHTTGTAAGSFMGNAYHGVAPGAELVACALPEWALTDVNVANSILYIFNYAQSVGKPAVVNMSISSVDGAHDGTSMLCRVMSALSGPGKICVVSAGNDGNVPTCLHKQFNGALDTLSVLLSNKYGGRNVDGYVSMWSADSVPHGLRVIVTDVATGALLYASPFYSVLPGDSVVEVADATDLQFAKYFTGSFRVASAIESNGKFHSIVEYNANNLQQDYVMGLQYVSAPGSRLNGWSDSYTRMSNFGLPGFTMGDCSMTISDLATGDSSISVGSYTSRSFAPVLSGHNKAVAGGTVGDISSFSSFGPDMRHVSRPEIVAPGQCVVSSYSRYDSTMAVNNNWLTAIAQTGGVSYPYGVDVGTSMSAPLVSGAIALMLQADARLGVDQVKRILKHTARRDHWVTDGDPERWGWGKLDVTAALRYMATGSLPGDVNGDGEVNVSDIACVAAVITHAIVNGDMAVRADLNGDGEVNVSDVTALVAIILDR